MNWDRWSIHELAAWSVCLGGTVVAGLCQTLAMDRQHWGGGLPDLFLYRIEQRGPETDGRPASRLLAEPPSSTKLTACARAGSFTARPRGLQQGLV